MIFNPWQANRLIGPVSFANVSFSLSCALGFVTGPLYAQVEATKTEAVVTETNPKVLRAKELVDLGLRYEHAEGVSKDFKIAQDAYCVAAQLDSAEGLMRLGWMYANGRGVDRNDAIASTLFKRAAALGNEMGQRLSEMIRADSEQLPGCLVKPIANPLTAALPIVKSALPNLPALPIVSIPRLSSFSQLSNADRQRNAQSVTSVAQGFKLDPRLVIAVMRAESNFDPLARSPKGAQGLMQLIPETAERFAVKDVTDPIENMKGGMAYLKWLLSFFRGDVVLSLAAYNAGEKTVERFGGVPPYPETMAYVQRIRSLYPADFHAYDERAAAYRKPANSKILKK